MAHYPIAIVTGAPGAGKSATLAALLALESGYVAFDIDWLVETASALVGCDIRFEPATWQPYNALWFAILHAICVNHQQPVLFAPFDKNDIANLGQPAWCGELRWLLLDCEDGLRRHRLAQRPDWTPAMIEEAITDAYLLRQTVPERLDTGTLQPNAVAMAIVEWLQRPS